MKLIFISILTIFTFIAGIVVLYNFVDEKHYNTLLMEYVSDRIVKNHDSFEGKVRFLRNFVHENVNPIAGEKNRADTMGVEKLTNGIGWCDQTSRVFMQLAKMQGITTRLLFLASRDGPSPHSVAEAWDGKRWILVDAQYNLEFYNKDGEMASMEDIRDNFDIILSNPKIKTFGLHNSSWQDPRYLSMYSNVPRYVVTKEAVNLAILDAIPPFLRKPFVCAVQDIYIFKRSKKFKNPAESLYFKGRNYHLVGRIESAERIYREILSLDSPPHIKDKTYFYLAILLRDQNRKDESIRVLTNLIKNRNNEARLPYAYSLRSRLYEDIGDKESTQRDFAKYANCLEAYF